MFFNWTFKGRGSKDAINVLGEVNEEDDTVAFSCMCIVYLPNLKVLNEKQKKELLINAQGSFESNEGK